MDTFIKSVGVVTLVIVGQLTIPKFVNVVVEGIQSAQLQSNSKVEISTQIYQPYDYGGPDRTEGSATR